MAITLGTLGFPRIGPQRDLKTVIEAYWTGEIDQTTLFARAAAFRAANWRQQAAAGITQIPSNDFSFFDHVLDTSAMVGGIPPAYGDAGSLDTYFARARGTDALPAGEITKWFDTNYHYVVPEFARHQTFMLTCTKPLDEFNEAKALGLTTRPVLLGPITYLLLGKAQDRAFDPLSLLPKLLPIYVQMLAQLGAAGADWVQMDEPALVLDPENRIQAAFRQAYPILAEAAGPTKLLLTTYFAGLSGNLDLALNLPVAGLHLDLVRAPEQLAKAAQTPRQDLTLSLGVIDGRNVWRADLAAIFDRIKPVVERRTGTISLAPSCSLIHVPLDVRLERDLDPQLTPRLAFAVQKMDELASLARALEDGRDVIAKYARLPSRSAPSIVTPAQTRDTNRAARQRASLSLPSLPTTTIGSFPQTAEVRKARADHARGALDTAGYKTFLKNEIAQAIAWQEEIGLDVLVHGEFERNEMVQYFAEQLDGFAATRHGWIQSYGTRYVRPPILWRDVARPQPVSVAWSAYAQSLTKRPVKGMVTGPLTMLQWSFVRDDQPREQTCRQIAMALCQEVGDLARAGICIVQIDEPAFREGLPLHRAERQDYLDWAAECFRIAASGAPDDVQIHTHMCYSDFRDIVGAIRALDADVISIEAALSDMDILGDLAALDSTSEIGPGVYDVHTPRIPTIDEIATRLRQALKHLPATRLWVNPDCGLKARTWDEIRPALSNMVAAAQRVRGDLGD